MIKQISDLSVAELSDLNDNCQFIIDDSNDKTKKVYFFNLIQKIIDRVSSSSLIQDIIQKVSSSSNKIDNINQKIDVMIGMPDWNSNSKITWDINNLPTNYVVTKNSILYVSAQRAENGGGQVDIKIDNYVHTLVSINYSVIHSSFLVSTGDIISITQDGMRHINTVLIPCK